ncbi:MAG: DNA-directed DNA polymerase II large subunit [Halobacteriales archaeon]
MSEEDRLLADDPGEGGDTGGDDPTLRPADRRYFETIESELDEALALAERAREGSRDPSESVEIPVAKDMADRVEKVLGIDGVAERVRQLEGEMSREEAALELATDFATGEVGDYETKAGKIEGAVRTAVALLTEGVVAAPIEGIDRVELLENDDGSEFVNIYYAGPIRSAGGTAQALSVLVADYVRTLVGVDEYRAREAEVGRYVEELNLYDEETGLQYAPKDAETEFIAEHVPVMLDGEATGDDEVDSHRGLDRVDTNSARGGMCLVLGEGIAQKAPKIQRYTRELDEVNWPWLRDLIDGTFKGGGDAGDDAGDDDADASGETADEEARPDGPPRAEPTRKFLRDLIAGRPVFSHPSEPGGFRLRYGRARNHGFATAGVHPATMHLVDDFLAAGTQIKTERPGKAAGVVPVDTIEGPTVRLANGDVRRIDDPEEAIEIRNGVEKVIDLGEYLVNYGEFVENNHPLVPAGYTFEWWVQEFADTDADVQALQDDPHVDLERPDEREAIAWAREHDVPLHPEYTYTWHDVSVSQFERLADAVAGGEIRDGELVVEHTHEVSEALEALLVEHRQRDAEIRVPEWRALALSLGVRGEGVEEPPAEAPDGRTGEGPPGGATDGGGVDGSPGGATDGGAGESSPNGGGDLERTWETLPAEAREWGAGEPGSNAVKAANAVAPFPIRERAPTRVGNRMGRPEKSEERELSPAVHCLFPLAEAGGDQRSVAEAASHAEGMQDTPGRIEVEVGRRVCEDCGERTWRNRCPECESHTDPHYTCPDCGQELTPDESGRVVCDRCEVEGTSVEPRTIDVRAEYRDALKRVGERENAFDVLKGVKGLSSEHKTPEPFDKGVLRAKHGVSAFKDGTVRYDMTDLPVTAVRPAELDVTAEQFRELGYETDVRGDPLEHDDQLVHLKVQDVILSDGAAEHMRKTADFVDDLLAEYYGLEPFYEVEDREDLVGELVFGMAPHTSAAVVGRVVGFTSAAVGYAHPYFHAAKRRNCFHPDTKVWYEDDAGWHHERIETLVEDRLTDPREDDFGTLVQELDGSIQVPSLDDEGHHTRKPVEAVSKHRSQDHLVEIRTRDGRELTVTPDHAMRRWTPSGIEEVEARELSAGDDLPTPKHVALGGRTASFDPLAESVEDDVGTRSQRVFDDGGDVWLDEVEAVAIRESDIEHTYSLTVADTHTLVANDIYVGQCDGDEDCVMLLMDGLLNFSEQYLPDKRGGRMDAPLVMTSRIDPTEIDDEAHNMDVVDRYPREFYEATREMADPGDVNLEIAEDTLATGRQYAGFDHTHDTGDIAAGPDLSAYKTLGSMMEKMEAQLELSRKLRSVDETDVAERVIEYHFLPDLLGNLRAFASQEVRCLDCGEKYRRAPLSGNCRECGGDVTLTVHRGSVNKYMDVSRRIADEYGADAYTRQRLKILEESLESIFEDDTNRQAGIADFM